VSNQGGAFVYTHVVGASEPSSYTWSGFIGDASGAMAAYSGVDNATPVNASSGAQDNDQGTATAPGVTTTRANVVLVGMWGLGGLVNQTPPTSMSPVWSGYSPAGLSILAAQEPWPTPGATGARIATGPGSQSYGQLVALQPPIRPYATTTWTPSSSGYAAGQEFRRTSSSVVQRQATLTATANSQSDGPLTTGTQYAVDVSATYFAWTSTAGSASFTGRAC
jgi:hypothetical protein